MKDGVGSSGGESLMVGMFEGGSKLLSSALTSHGAILSVNVGSKFCQHICSQIPSRSGSDQQEYRQLRDPQSRVANGVG